MINEHQFLSCIVISAICSFAIGFIIGLIAHRR